MLYWLTGLGRNPGFLTALALVANPGGFLRLRVDQHDVADVNWKGFLDDAAGRLERRLGLVVALHHVDAFYYDFLLLGIDGLHNALFTFIFAGEHQDGVAFAYVGFWHIELLLQ